VYWNLAGAQNWSATGWCPSSGGTPDINQFPLAQDTAVFDNTGSVTGTITINASWNIGTFDASSRTSAMTLASGTTLPVIYLNWKSGSGLTLSTATGGLYFYGRGTQTITSNGVAFNTSLAIDCVTGTVQLADALTLNSTSYLNLNSGTFDAVTYNVTTGLVSLGSTIVQTLKMGTGTWTLSGTGNVWNVNNATNFTFLKGTANIVLSDTSTTARTFIGTGLSYNKLTIGGTTGTSTTTINGDNQFTELASTKTVAHTISSTQALTLGAWTVTGTVGNVVTVAGTATITIAGARVSGIDYLALGTTTISATSPGEFYAGANSTGGTNAILTAAPAAVTRYWRGGSGTWDATTQTNWASTSGGAGPASVPTSADAVVFDTLSNATAYTVTCTATQLRCAALTMAGPATGNVTWAGTAPLAVHGNFSLSATGITRSYSGAITFSGSTTGKTITTNGVTIVGSPFVNGIGCGWTLGSAFSDGSAGSTITVTNGTFDTGNFALTTGAIASSNSNSRTINLGSSTCTVQGFPAGFTNAVNLTFNAGTSSIVCTNSAAPFNGGGLTFYNVSFANVFTGTQTINGANTFNNLSFTGITSSGLKIVSVTANQTINGTLTISAGTDATMRTFLQSNTLGTTRTLTCAAFSGTDVDFRDITIAGAAAPVSGTRLGDCKGNSGITFGAGVTRYWNLVGGGNWSGTGWAATSGGSPAANNFPLAQDTALFESTGLNSGATVTINDAWNIGTINMSARTSNTMTLANSTNAPFIYGNWINGTGTTLSGAGTLTFAGRGSQTITSANNAFTQSVTVNSPGGSVTLQDNFSCSLTTYALVLTNGTFNANNFNFTHSATGATGSVFASNSNIRTLALGSGTWTLAASLNPWFAQTSTNLTVTGTGTISLTSASAKNFQGGGISYSGITLNQGGAGTLTIVGNNTFKDITNTYSATGSTTINIGTTTQTVTQFTGTGTSGKVLTIQGSSASSPGTLVLTGATNPNVDYLIITGIRAYNLATTWYAGANSTNNGSLGWIFASGIVAITGLIAEGASGLDSVLPSGSFSIIISEAASGLDSVAFFGAVYNFSVVEAASGLDAIFPSGTFNISVLESGSGLDAILSSYAVSSSISEAASGLDSQSSNITFTLSVLETGSGLDSVISTGTFNLSVLEISSGLDSVANTGTFNIGVLEAGSGLDSVINTGIFNIGVSETSSGLDSQSSNITFTLSVDETASGLDAVVRSILITAIVNEAASALEALGVGGTFNIAVTEAASGQDQISNIGTFKITITEAATGAAVLTARLLWEPIDDQQTPNWTTINTTQTPGWTDIPTQ
jgi:hypothetical protein